jgi:hypothetical protein
MAVELNEAFMSGTVMEDPMFSGEGPGSWGFLKLMTSFGQLMPDNTYQDVEQPVQIVADLDRHVNTMRKYIKRGKALTVYGYYRTWEAGGQINHGFFVRKFTFARANWGQEQQGQGNAPQMS